MRVDEVPQDKSKTYAGHKKLLYAQAGDGRYTGVQSSGWEIEEAATCDAVAEYERLAAEALEEVRAGKKSPLYYHMYNSRMEPLLLSQMSGYWRWRVRRHFSPKHFARLPDAILQRYADAMDISLAELKTFPGQSL